MAGFFKLRDFKRKYRFFKDEEPVLIRKSDRTLWIADYDPDNPMKGIFEGEVYYYFRRCRKFLDGYIIDRSKVWEFKDPKLFEVFDNREAI
jgi:hypothetical protein